MTDRVRAPNILLIKSDEHAAGAAGCYGHPVVRTPHLDRLAAAGLRYDAACTASPICVPARMSFMTGRYPHQIDVWDNGCSLSAGVPTMGSYLEAAGYDTVRCGRAHFVGAPEAHGWGRTLIGDLPHWQRREGRPPPRTATARRASNSHVTECGPGEHRYSEYDRTVADLAARFLRTRPAEADAAALDAAADAAPSGGGRKPWLLYVGFMRPHFPLTCPAEYFERYRLESLQLPATGSEPLEHQHPSIRQLRYFLHQDAPLDPTLTRSALASYYGLISFIDDLVGSLVAEVDGSRLADDTVIIYTSDHGEMAGEHGLWQKMCFYESAVRVPLLVRLPGPANVAGRAVATPASLVDVLPTLLDLAGATPAQELPGASLLAPDLLEPGASDRAVFSEYHAQGMLDGAFMVRDRRYKYCHYVDAAPQLFDLSNDPLELTDEAASDLPELVAARARLHEQLLAITDPVATDARAKHDQARRRARG